VNEVSCLFVRPEVERVHRGLIYRPLRNFNAFRFGRELQGGTSSLSPLSRTNVYFVLARTISKGIVIRQELYPSRLS